MADSYNYTFIERETGSRHYPDKYIGDNTPNIGDIIDLDGGHKFRVVNVDETSTFKDYDDHGSEYDYDITVTVEKTPIFNINGFLIVTSVHDNGISIDRVSPDTGTSNLTIPDTIDGLPVTKIGKYAFVDCKTVTEITLPDSVQQIDYAAFQECYGITKLVLPKALRTMSPYSIKDCWKLEYLYIPASTLIDTESVDKYFSGCKRLKTIEVDKENPLYDSRNNCNAIIETATNKLLIVCEGTVLPDSVTEIDKRIRKKVPLNVWATYYSKVSTKSWENWDMLLKNNNSNSDTSNCVYMDIHNGMMHLHEHLLFGPQKKHCFCDLNDIDLKSFIPAWSDLKGHDCSTLESFLESLKKEFNDTDTYYCSDFSNFSYFLRKYKVPYKEIERKSDLLLLYLHGFGSSGNGNTVKTLQELLPDWIVFAPDIPVDPVEALPFLQKLCNNLEPDVIVGTSMGGVYAQQIRSYERHIYSFWDYKHRTEQIPAKRICVNPAFDISKHKDILKEGTFEFLNPRKNGEKTFTITPEIIQHFAEMEAHQFNGISDDDKENVYGLFADGDTTVNCEDIFRQHYKNVVHFHGEHRLNREAIEDVLVPLIKRITNK